MITKGREKLDDGGIKKNCLFTSNFEEKGENNLLDKVVEEITKNLSQIY